MNVMQLRASDEQVLLRRKPNTLPDYTCGVKVGDVVRKGWIRFFDTVVDIIGDKVLIDEDTGWLVPVMYTNGKFGILLYRFYDRRTGKPDHTIEIKSGVDTCNWHISNTLKMPKIVAVREGSVIIHVSQETAEDDGDLVPATYEVKDWEIRLHNVLQITGKKDEILPLVSTGVD